MGIPEVYIDLDGVLADFFAEYAKAAGISSGKYREVPPNKNVPTLDSMVGTDFFSKLPKFSSSDQLIEMIISIFGKYNICSSPLRGDHKNSEKHKKIWIKEQLSHQPEKIIISPHKHSWAKQPDGTPNILIDDRGNNITLWEHAGGIGIKYQADEDGLEKIVEGITRAKRIIKGEEKHIPQKLKSIHRGPDTEDIAKENDEICDPRQLSPIMAKESASGGATSSGAIASTPSAGGGWLFGGTVGAPKTKRRKSKVIKR